MYDMAADLSLGDQQGGTRVRYGRAQVYQSLFTHYAVTDQSAAALKPPHPGCQLGIEDLGVARDYGPSIELPEPLP
jgi:hypothetical protein